MRWNGLLAGTVLLLVSLAMGTSAVAQDEPVSPSEEAGGEETKSKLPFGLYVEAATGVATADDINTSITTLSTHRSLNYLSLEDQVHARAALGWKLPHGQGEFRLRFDGFKEDGYRFSARGLQAALDQELLVEDPLLGNVSISGNLDWWALDVENGTLHAERTPPVWDPLTDDTNANSVVDPEEVRYPNVDQEVDNTIASDLQNRAQLIEFMYGRGFGSGRYTARWWAGFRYFTFKGNTPAAAWLLTTTKGEGYTDNALVPLLNFYAQADGFGPTGSMEADFNFFDDRLTLYLQGQFAFMLLDLSVDSGPFSTFVEQEPSGTEIRYLIPIDAHLTATRNKSTWQDAIEAGIRYKMKNGLQLELAYHKTGFLDVILTPIRIAIPENVEESRQGTSALYRTQDYILSGWRAGVAFQF